MKLIDFINTLREKYNQISPPVLIKKKNGLEFYQFSAKNTRAYTYLVVTDKKKEITKHQIIAKNKIKSEINKVLEQKFWEKIKIKKIPKKQKQVKKEKLFNDDKLIRDLVMIYTGYAYIDVDLKENGYIKTDKNNTAYLTQTARDSEDYQIIKKLFNTEKMVYNAILSTGVRFDNLKGEILAQRVKKELNKAFGSNPNIIGFYLGSLALFTYKDLVKNKKVFLNVDTQFLADLTTDLSDKYRFYEKNKDMEKILDNCENIVDRLFENLYKNESWYKE
jgi:hypothetical protein